MELSKRLKTIADMVTEGMSVADVGCDHGFVSIYLYQHKNAPRVYAMDVRTGPLSRAKEHIEAYGLSQYIETRLSDGLRTLLPGEAQALVCAGMGGRLMVKILSEGYDKILLMKELILQPQSELSFFREYLRTHGLVIVQEDMVKEDGKFYPVIKAVPSKEAWENAAYTRAVQGGGCGAESLSEKERQRISDSFGPLLLEQRHPVLLEYLKLLQDRNEKILRELTECGAYTRLLEIKKELKDIERCLAFYEGGAEL